MLNTVTHYRTVCSHAELNRATLLKKGGVQIRQSVNVCEAGVNRYSWLCLGLVQGSSRYLPAESGSTQRGRVLTKHVWAYWLQQPRRKIITQVTWHIEPKRRPHIWASLIKMGWIRTALFLALWLCFYQIMYCFCFYSNYILFTKQLNNNLKLVTTAVFVCNCIIFSALKYRQTTRFYITLPTMSPISSALLVYCAYQKGWEYFKTHTHTELNSTLCLCASYFSICH